METEVSLQRIQMKYKVCKWCVLSLRSHVYHGRHQWFSVLRMNLFREFTFYIVAWYSEKWRLVFFSVLAFLFKFNFFSFHFFVILGCISIGKNFCRRNYRNVFLLWLYTKDEKERIICVSSVPLLLIFLWSPLGFTNFCSSVVEWCRDLMESNCILSYMVCMIEEL